MARWRDQTSLVDAEPCIQPFSWTIYRLFASLLRPHALLFSSLTTPETCRVD